VPQSQIAPITKRENKHLAHKLVTMEKKIQQAQKISIVTSLLACLLLTLSALLAHHSKKKFTKLARYAG
jgi:hypothetical protein